MSWYSNGDLVGVHRRPKQSIAVVRQSTVDTPARLRSSLEVEKGGRLQEPRVVQALHLLSELLTGRRHARRAEHTIQPVHRFVTRRHEHRGLEFEQLVEQAIEQCTNTGLLNDHANAIIEQDAEALADAFEQHDVGRAVGEQLFEFHAQGLHSSIEGEPLAVLEPLFEAAARVRIGWKRAAHVLLGVHFQRIEFRLQVLQHGLAEHTAHGRRRGAEEACCGHRERRQIGYLPVRALPKIDVHVRLVGSERSHSTSQRVEDDGQCVEHVLLQSQRLVEAHLTHVHELQSE